MADEVTRNASRVATLVAVPLALLVGALVFWLMGGLGRGGGGSGAARSPGPQSSAAVAMPAPQLPERAATVCRALLSQLPNSLRELGRRPVTSGAEQNAAYGDPAITLTCGGPAPTFPPTDTVYTLDRVCWHAVPEAAATVFTTVDREVPVRVTVPAAYDPPGQWAIEFSPPVIAAVPAAAQMPSGCR